MVGGGVAVFVFAPGKIDAEIDAETFIAPPAKASILRRFETDLLTILDA